MSPPIMRSPVSDEWFDRFRIRRVHRSAMALVARTVRALVSMLDIVCVAVLLHRHHIDLHAGTLADAAGGPHVLAATHIATLAWSCVHAVGTPYNP